MERDEDSKLGTNMASLTMRWEKNKTEDQRGNRDLGDDLYELI